MVLILLSIIVAAIVVAISMTSCESLPGSRIARETIAIGKERCEQPAIASPTKQFLVVVLPDGKVLNRVLADLF
jgi:hypothetical protein